MDKKRRLIFGMFCLLILVFVLDIGYAQLKKTSNLEFLEKKPTVESQIKSLNKKLTILETEQVVVQKKIKVEEKKMEIARITKKVFEQQNENIEKEKKGILEEKKKLGLYQRPK